MNGSSMDRDLEGLFSISYLPTSFVGGSQTRMIPYAHGTRQGICGSVKGDDSNVNDSNCGRSFEA